MSSEQIGRPRTVVADLPAYRPGKGAAQAEAEHGITDAIKLASNENPAPPLDPILAAITDAAHGVNRFILSSTAALFDQPARVPIDEKERVIPGSPYGESKAMIERLLLWADRIHGLRSWQRASHHQSQTVDAARDRASIHRDVAMA